MAEPGRTVRLSGLPTDIDDDRLKDKLSIHFLRSRNGGGEIDSVIILGAKANSALITFEDSRVAQSVVQRRWHVLEVDGVKYELHAIEHYETPEPDKVVLHLMATVDYSQLPAGKKVVLSLPQNHPDVQMTFDPAATLCNLYGAYSKVQSALAYLLGDPAQSLVHKNSGQHGTSVPSLAQTLLSQDQSRRHSERQERGRNEAAGEGSSQREDPLHGGYDREPTSPEECETSQPSRQSLVSQDDPPLIVDADLFRYLKRCCREDYDHILRVHDVEAVEMTNQGVTTLFLQASTAAAARDGGCQQERTNLARVAISKLCQDNEDKVCQVKLSKDLLSHKRGLEKEMEDLSLRFPKLLLTDDDKNVYFIGSHSDVAKARGLLLLDAIGMRSPPDDRNRLPTSPSLASASSSPCAEERSPPIRSFPTVPLEDDQIGQLLHSDEDDRRAEGAKKYKLAARFKDSSLLASRPGLSPPSKLSHPSPVLLPGTQLEAWNVDGRVSRGQNSREETLEKGDSLHSCASSKSRLTCFCDRNETLSKSPKAVHGTIQPSPPESPLKTGQSEPSLQRSNSFTGLPLRKPQDQGQRMHIESGKTAVRTRGKSFSFSNQKGMDRPKVYSAEITISYLMWLHIKDAYVGRMEDLLSDVQVKESVSHSSRDSIIVLIRGADQSKVTSSQLGLLKLVEMVSADFTQEKIALSELGVDDDSNETLQACFAQVHSRYKKITIHPRKKSIYLLGPKQLCTRVSKSVREVFSDNGRQKLEKPDFPTDSTYKWNQPADSQLNENQSLHSSSNSLAMLKGQSGKFYGSSSEVREEIPHDTVLNNASLPQLSAKTDPVITQKVRRELDEQRTSVEPSKISDNGRHVNGVGYTSTHTDEGFAIPSAESLRESAFERFELGQSQFAAQVKTSLPNVFSDGPKIPEKREPFSLSPSSCTQPTALAMNESHSLYGNYSAWAMREGQTDKDSGPVVKPKGRGERPLVPDSQKPLSNMSASETGERITNNVGLASPHSDDDVGLHINEKQQHSLLKEPMQQRKAEFQATLKQPRSAQGAPGYICVCGSSDTPMKQTECGATMCLQCLEDVHVNCRACHTAPRPSRGIKGNITQSYLSISMPGHPKDPAIKITYHISDGIQGENHPSPGQPFKGDIFEAFFPDCVMARRLLPRLKEAFKRGLTFTVVENLTGARVVWDCIPHKTSINGGKSGNGYPDSSYLKRLADVLSSHGIRETSNKS